VCVCVCVELKCSIVN